MVLPYSIAQHMGICVKNHKVFPALAHQEYAVFSCIY